MAPFLVVTLPVRSKTQCTNESIGRHTAAGKTMVGNLNRCWVWNSRMSQIYQEKRIMKHLWNDIENTQNYVNDGYDFN